MFSASFLSEASEASCRTKRSNNRLLVISGVARESSMNERTKPTAAGASTMPPQIAAPNAGKAKRSHKLRPLKQRLVANALLHSAAKGKSNKRAVKQQPALLRTPLDNTSSSSTATSVTIMRHDGDSSRTMHNEQDIMRSQPMTRRTKQIGATSSSSIVAETTTKALSRTKDREHSLGNPKPSEITETNSAVEDEIIGVSCGKRGFHSRRDLVGEEREKHCASASCSAPSSVADFDHSHAKTNAPNGTEICDSEGTSSAMIRAGSLMVVGMHEARAGSKCVRTNDATAETIKEVSNICSTNQAGEQLESSINIQRQNSPQQQNETKSQVAAECDRQLCGKVTQSSCPESSPSCRIEKNSHSPQKTSQNPGGKSSDEKECEEREKKLGDDGNREAHPKSDASSPDAQICFSSNEETLNAPESDIESSLSDNPTKKLITMCEESSERAISCPDLKQIQTERRGDMLNCLEIEKNGKIKLNNRASPTEGLSTKFFSFNEKCGKPHSDVDLQQFLDDDDLKTSIKNNGGLQKVINHDLWSIICSDMDLPCYNINIINYVKQYCLFLYDFECKMPSFQYLSDSTDPDGQANLLPPIVNFKLRPRNRFIEKRDDLSQAKSVVKRIEAKLHSGLYREIDFALNTILQLFLNQEVDCLSLLVTNENILAPLFFIAGIKYQQCCIKNSKNFNGSFQEFNNLYKVWKNNEISKKFDPFKFWQNSLCNSDINKELLKNILGLNDDTKRQISTVLSGSAGGFAKYSNNFYNFGESYDELKNQIKIILTIMLHLLKFRYSNSKFTNASLYKNIIDHILYLSLLGYYSNEPLIHSLALDLLIEISNVIDLAQYNTNAINPLLQVNPTGISRLNPLICDEILQILSNDLASADASCILTSLNIIANLTGNKSSASNVSIFDNWFIENETNLQSFLNCLLLMSSPERGSEFSTYEVIKIFATEVIFNMSFFKTSLLVHENFIIIHTITATLKYLIPLCALRLKRQNPSKNFKKNNNEPQVNSTETSNTNLETMHENVLDHIISQITVILKNLIHFEGHNDLEIPGLISHIILTLQLSIGRQDTHLNYLLSRLLKEKQDIMSENLATS